MLLTDNLGKESCPFGLRSCHLLEPELLKRGVHTAVFVLLTLSQNQPHWPCIWQVHILPFLKTIHNSSHQWDKYVDHRQFHIFLLLLLANGQITLPITLTSKQTCHVSCKASISMSITKVYQTKKQNKNGNIRGDGWKFLGHFKCHFGVTDIIWITHTGSYLANEVNICNKFTKV